MSSKNDISFVSAYLHVSPDFVKFALCHFGFTEDIYY